MKTQLIVPILTFLVAAQAATADEKPKGDQPLIPRDAGSASLRREVQHAIDKGLAFLKTQQKPEGWFSTADYPAITGLALTAFLRDPENRYTADKSEIVKNGVAYLLSCAHPDGGIYKKTDLLNYNTSVAMMTLLAVDNSKYNDLLRRSREFLAGSQRHLDGDPHDGGIGYGDDNVHSDMSNMVMALEALHSTEHLKGVEVAATKDLDWKAAIGFIQRCQNLPEYNKEPYASGDPQNKGGFIYYPGKSQAGKMTLPDGKVALRSYGSISYDGLLSYVYADVKRDDPRVQAVFEWLQKNFTLDENPGMGMQGRYYYYHTMAKALATYGADKLTSPEGKQVDWKADLGKKLLDLQKPDGSWSNSDSGRWWEKDPVLVTSYAVMTLEIIYRAM
jgi:squalene-hopene/tetraprenyl-beta-curcumene cyclase